VFRVVELTSFMNVTVASIVLLNNDLSSIPVAIEMGRLVFDNLKKVLLYLMPVGSSLIYVRRIVLYPHHRLGLTRNSLRCLRTSSWGCNLLSVPTCKSAFALQMTS
jgi:hypothetical protein